MFAIDCPQHGSKVLIFMSGVKAIRNTDEGIEVDYRCTCGHRGTWRTGRAEQRAVARNQRRSAQPVTGAGWPVASRAAATVHGSPRPFAVTHTR